MTTYINVKQKTITTTTNKVFGTKSNLTADGPDALHKCALQRNSTMQTYSMCKSLQLNYEPNVCKHNVQKFHPTLKNLNMTEESTF